MLNRTLTIWRRQTLSSTAVGEVSDTKGWGSQPQDRTKRAAMRASGASVECVKLAHRGALLVVAGLP
jgi:hypothetical protein